MSELLLEKKLRESQQDDEVRKIARVRTLTTLLVLNASRKGNVLQFLYESELIDKDNYIVDLYRADLKEAFLPMANLSGILLSGAQLGKANLIGAILIETD